MLTQEQMNQIRNYSNSERQFNDNCKSFDTLGHYFKFNVATTLANSYNIQGKPTLNADAIVGAVRRYKDEDGQKICGGFIVLHSDDESCTMQAIRLDERKAAQAQADALNKPLLIALEKATDPELIKYILNMIASNNVTASKAGIHTHTFTMAHAKQRGKDKDRAWRQMPKNMLQKRCATALARQAFPEIIGVTYSPDEYAEMVVKDEDERDAIVFASAAGERVPSRAPAPMPAPKPTPKPTPKPATRSNPYPRVYQAVNMTASEALIKLKDLNDGQVLSLAKETQAYLMGCVLGDTPIEHVTNALTKLKVKEYQETIDMMHAVAAKHGDFDDKMSNQIVEYITNEKYFTLIDDVVCYDFYDTLKDML